MTSSYGVINNTEVSSQLDITVTMQNLVNESKASDNDKMLRISVVGHSTALHKAYFKDSLVFW